MNYLISTTHQESSVSHIVKGLGTQEIQSLFVPTSILPHADDQPMEGYDLVVEGLYQGKEFQIISSFQKVIDLFEWLAPIIIKHNEEVRTKKQEESMLLKVLSINSLSKPLDQDHMHEFLTQLETKYTEKAKVITPQVVELVKSMSKDVKEFIIRFTGYIEATDLDMLQARSNDMEVFTEQGKLEDIKKRMGQLIDKMEVLESNYVKQINIDEDKPLNQFNQELHTVMNQNRLFRYHGLNQLSGGSKFDYVLYRIISRIKLWFDAFGMEFKDVGASFTAIGGYATGVINTGLIIALIGLFLYKHFADQTIVYPFELLGIIGLVSTLCYWVSAKKPLVAVVLMLIFVGLGSLAYEFLTINMGL